MIDHNKSPFARATKKWQLLEIALEDLAEVEKDPQYYVHMTSWHTPFGGICHVCLAGAVMAMDFNANLDEHLQFSDYSQEIKNKFLLLDDLRVGKVPGADELSRKVPSYERDREGWWNAIKVLLGDLKARDI